MARGGRRTGAGRKKKAEHLRLIDGGAGRRGGRQADDDGALPAIAEPGMLEPPDDLTDAELAVWNAWAPLAHKERTLMPSTFANFVQLCQAEVDRRELRDRYQRARKKITGELLPLVFMDPEEELSLRREHRTLMKDIHARMKDFKLAPFGKEIFAPGETKTEDDPLAQFTNRKRG